MCVCVRVCVVCVWCVWGGGVGSVIISNCYYTDDAENNSTIELEGDEEEGREGKEEEEEEEEEDEEGEEEEEEEEEEDEEGEEEEEKEEEEEEEGEESLGGTGDGSGDGRGKEVAMDTNTTIKCTKVLPPQPISSGHSVFVQLSRPVEVEVCSALADCVVYTLSLSRDTGCIADSIITGNPLQRNAAVATAYCIPLHSTVQHSGVVLLLHIPHIPQSLLMACLTPEHVV